MGYCKYIIDDSGGKLYIHKITGDNQVLLSSKKSINDSSGYIIFKSKEFIFNKHIHTEL